VVGPLAPANHNIINIPPTAFVAACAKLEAHMLPLRRKIHANM
jgi:hypothetical protein